MEGVRGFVAVMVKGVVVVEDGVGKMMMEEYESSVMGEGGERKNRGWKRRREKGKIGILTYKTHLK